MRGRKQCLEEDSVQAGAQLQHGVHLCLNLEKVSGRAAPLLGQFGNGLTGIVHIGFLMHSLPDHSKAASSNHLANSIPALDAMVDAEGQFSMLRPHTPRQEGTDRENLNHP